MQKRYAELDFLRGLAIICMVIYHFFFILDFFGVYGVDFENLVVRIFAAVVRFDFLALVGVGMVISYYRVLGRRSVGREFRAADRAAAIFKQWKRGAMVGACALVVMAATYWFIPEYFVRFGILHLIAVSIFFWSFFVEWKWVVLGLALVSFWLGWGGVDFTEILFGYFLRDMLWNIAGLDYFPLFPWMGMVGMGVFLGQVFYPKGVRCIGRALEQQRVSERTRVIPRFRVVCFLGRHSLAVYMIHVPAILVVLWVMGLVRV